MSLTKKLIKHLEDSGKKHHIVEHRTVYTAYDAAATMKRDLKEVVKTLLIKTDKPLYGYQKSFVVVCLAANRNVDFSKLQKCINNHIVKITPRAEKVVRIKKVSIPKESVIKKTFKVKPGSMHAFGSLYKLPVFLDSSVTKVKKAVFPAGSYTESIEMRVVDYMKIEEVIKCIFSSAKKAKKKKKS